eukprot:PLAT9935.1.p1 GENE.PLAT9935.1~~PLAT9935.1.p1  ORF type:complete len:377 (-),score=146.73 PLAT9935.1:156-1286(-)
MGGPLAALRAAKAKTLSRDRLRKSAAKTDLRRAGGDRAASASKPAAKSRRKKRAAAAAVEDDGAATGSKEAMHAPAPRKRSGKRAAGGEEGGSARKKRKQKRRRVTEGKAGAAAPAGGDDSAASAAGVRDGGAAGVEERKSDKQRRRKLARAAELSPLQLAMRRKLMGGRFRWINEQLYTMRGDSALQLFTEEPELFEEYHSGFRKQVGSWPVNPVDLFIAWLRKRPQLSVADFGCGEAAIARSVRNRVHSFDLVAARPEITAADMAHVPLDDAAVDVAIFCLALMGTNVVDALLEARRVLKPSGTLMIAEVKSRLETDGCGGIPGFISALRKLGFDLKAHDDRNRMFVLFVFTRADREPKPSVSLSLKACRYKKR